MANGPPFATLNQFAADLGIPSESQSLRIGITARNETMGIKHQRFVASGVNSLYESLN